jgi:hypothetical protein
MFAGQTVRGGLRSRRLRIAVGVTAAAAMVGLGGAITAQASDSGPALKESVKNVKFTDDCWESEPATDVVEAEPVEGEVLPKPDSYKDYTFDDEGPVDAVPGDDECAQPEPGGDPVEAEPEPVEEPVEAVPGDSDDVVTPDSYHDAKVAAPSKR